MSMCTLQRIGWTVSCAAAGLVSLASVYASVDFSDQPLTATGTIPDPPELMPSRKSDHGLSQHGTSRARAAVDRGRELNEAQLDRNRVSNGAPPIWPEKTAGTLANEQEFRSVLDSEHLPRDKNVGKLTRAAEESPIEQFQRLSGPQPFIHGDLFAMTSGLVRQIEKPITNKVVLMESDKYRARIKLKHKQDSPDAAPTVADHGFGQAVGVFHDGSSFIMYYREGKSIGRAESQDGLAWGKRDRRIIQFDMKYMTGMDFCILHDVYEEQADIRWKMTFSCDDKSMKKDSVYRMHMCLAGSPDGIRWTNLNDGKPFSGPFADTLACLHHDSPGEKYVLTKRYEHEVGMADQARGVRGTLVLAGSLKIDQQRPRRITWKPKKVLAQWILDKEYGEAEKYRRQMYAVSRARLTNKTHLGIAWVYEFPCYTQNQSLQETLKEKAVLLGVDGSYDSVRLYMFPSRDGVHFDHSWIYAGVPLVPDDRHEYHFMTAAGQIITHGGYHWIYYDRSPAIHENRWAKKAKILVARFYEGRLVRVRPLQTRGFLLTKSFEFDPSENLYLDVIACGASSEVSVALVREAAGKSVGLGQAVASAKADPIREADGVVSVQWQTNFKDVLHQRVHLRFDLTESSLYGFYFGDKPERQSSSCRPVGAKGSA